MIDRFKRLFGKCVYKLGGLTELDSLCSCAAECELESPVKLYTPHRLDHARVGKYTYLAENSHVSRTRIGRFCSIGPNFLCGRGIHPVDKLATSPMFYSTRKQNGFSLSASDKCDERRPVEIGNDVFIGANVTVLDGVHIGDGAVIGAGALVNHDIPPYAIVGGVPAKILRYRFTPEQIAALLRIRWWNFPEEQLSEVEKSYDDVAGFIARFDPESKS